MPRGRKPIPIAQRFWPKVDKRGPDDCWLWTGSEHGKGYGGFSYRGRSVPAQRISWLLEHGEPPDNLFVCHTCDVPKCVNPAHLFLGDHQANMADMVAKGRSTYGRVGGLSASGICNPWKQHIDATADELKHLVLRAGYVYDFESKEERDSDNLHDFVKPQKIY